MATDDDDRTVADRVRATELEVPVARGDDDEATSVDPPREQLRPQGQVDAVKVTRAEVPKTDVGPAHKPSSPPVPDADDDATQARPPPAYLRKPAPREPEEDHTQTQPPPPPPPPGYYGKNGTYAKSKGGTDEYNARKPLHPLIVISVGIAVLFVMLLVFNWVRTSHVLESEPDVPPGDTFRPPR